MAKCVRTALLLLFLFPTAIRAQWSVSGYIGQTHTRNQDVQAFRSPDTDVSFKDVEFDDRSFNTPLYYGFRASYAVSPLVRVEGEFIHNKVFGRVDEPVPASGTVPPIGNLTATVPPFLVVQRYNVSHGYNLLFGNVVLQRQVIPRLSVAFRAGVGIGIPHPEMQAFGETIDEYQIQGTAVQFGGGVEVSLTRHLFWLGEYKFTSTHPRFELGGGFVETSFQTHHFVTGIGVRF
jgi:lipid A oxidase